MEFAVGDNLKNKTKELYVKLIKIDNLTCELMLTKDYVGVDYHTYPAGHTFVMMKEFLSYYELNCHSSKPSTSEINWFEITKEIVGGCK